ncbi:DUF1289 domain-containing protein [Roseospirillum parvum]|uniref:DUF1289 domain-containing protein n=1 Tax=Roseospirillum parvum TaxID=83401 RepID=A0A1G7XUF1_9PROT|nr:DUF1289 domain-containing protein [Roseospirillum parvum]SDG87663.1 hypothetical protein SAMN05421742_10396 [Roseospirillum parvum]
MTDSAALITLPSPCIGVCELDPTDRLCKGCQRSGSEIGAWRDGDAQTRAAIWAHIRQRRAERDLPPHPRDPASQP